MKILKILYYLIAIFIAGIALLFIVSSFPITGNIKFFIVQSGSMQPAIKMGDLIVIKPSNDYQLGDVITFSWSKGRDPISHRIQEIKTDGTQVSYITKGDANTAPDQEQVRTESILGKVILDIPFLGYVIDFTKKPFGFILIIIIPAIIVIFDETKKIIKVMKKKNA